MKLTLTLAGFLAGILTTRWYDQSPRARAVTWWLWTMDQRPRRHR